MMVTVASSGAAMQFALKMCAQIVVMPCVDVNPCTCVRTQARMWELCGLTGCMTCVNIDNRSLARMVRY